MTVYDQAREVENNLPDYLHLQYEPGYEIIVVDESSTDNTDDVLKLFRNDNSHLYSTFLPKPDRNVMRRRLAFTLGVKAAKYEWVIITSIDYRPTSEKWLETVAGFTDSSTEMILGYTKGTTTRYQQFSDFNEGSRLLRKAERKRADGHQGSHLKYLRGKYDFLVVRKDLAHEVLKLFDEQIGWSRLLGLRMNVMLQELLGISQTTKAL